MKRGASENAAVSPPPTKRKVESGTTNQAVASFFAPTSTKKTTPVNWSVLHGTLLKGVFRGSAEDRIIKRRKIAAFDFDSTLITTSSGNVFGKDARDWRWLHGNAPSKLRNLYEDGYRVTILSNQGGINLVEDKKPSKKDADRLTNFKEKVGYVLNQLDIPITVYAATGKDHYRKPRVGMWRELLDDYDLDEGSQPESSTSFFVGDAAGRIASKGLKADHSSGDRNFASNIGIGFQTPEQFFQGSDSREWKRAFDPQDYRPILDAAPFAFTKVNEVDIILLCGSPGSGKSTFYQAYLQPLGYARVNQDQLKSREKCVKAATEHLSHGKCVAVDNTNADVATREVWIALAKSSGVPIRCLLFETPPEACRHNDTVRAQHSGHAAFNPERRDGLPFMAFTGFQSRFRPPETAEGFQDVVRVPFRFRGDEDQWRIWSQYWT